MIKISKKEYENYLKFQKISDQSSSNEATIKALTNAISSLSNEVDSLNKKVKDLEAENAYLKELARYRAIQKFCKKSDNYEQLSLFDDAEATHAEAELEEKIEEDKVVSVNGYKRKNNKKKNLVNDENNFETVIKDVTIDDPKYVDIHADKIVRKLQFQPAKYRIEEIHYHTYSYLDQDGNKKVVVATRNIDPFGKSMVSTKLVSKIIYDKVILSIPLYRQEQEFSKNGINLSRQDMSNYFYKAYDILEPLGKRLETEVKASEVIRSDETTLNILNFTDESMKKGKLSASNSYVWVFSNGIGSHQASLYKVGPTRSREVFVNFFGEEKHRYLHVDGYSGYEGIKNVEIVPCMAHVRRKFCDAYKLSKSKNSICADIIKKLDLIFFNDKEIRNKFVDDYDQIRISREQFIRPLFDDFFKTIEEVSLTVLEKSKLGNAIAYALGRKKNAYNFFKDGRLELSNNASERKVKDFVIGRKNWLFANTEEGAEKTCLMYSILRSACDNNLKPFEYLNYLLENIDSTKKQNMDDFVPRSKKIPDEIRLD